MNKPDLIQGRHLGAAQLAQARQLLADHPHGSRRQLSRHVAALWRWRNPAGQFEDVAAHALWCQLEARGWITLPPCKAVCLYPLHSRFREHLEGTSPLTHRLIPTPRQAPVGSQALA